MQHNHGNRWSLAVSNQYRYFSYTVESDKELKKNVYFSRSSLKSELTAAFSHYYSTRCLLFIVFSSSLSFNDEVCTVMNFILISPIAPCSAVDAGYSPTFMSDPMNFYTCWYFCKKVSVNTKWTTTEIFNFCRTK